MPLYGQNGQGRVNQTFDHIVPGTADRDKPFACAVYGLMVGGVYLDVCSVELVKEITSAQVAVKDIVELVAPDPFVVLGGVDMLSDVAAEMDVDELKPFADTEHGLFLCRKAGKYFKLQDVKFCVDMAGTVVGLAEKGGRNVVASREKQMCRCVCSPGIQAGKKGNIQLYQGVFVVFCAFRAACNEYG